MKLLTHLTLLAFFLILNSNDVISKTRNQIIEESIASKLGTANPVLLGEYIIYQVLEDNVSSLWSFNTLTSEKTRIFTGNLSRFAFRQDYIYIIDDFAYFVSGQDFDFLFWKTDGSLAGTTALDSPTFFPYHSKIDDFLFTWSNQGSLLSTDGEEVIEHMINNPAITTICPFANNDVVAVINENTNRDTAIVRSKEGQITNISSNFSTRFEVREGNSFYFNGNCHILAHDYENNIREWFVIPQDGPVTLMSEHIEVIQVSHMFSFKDNIYVRTSNASSLYRLNADLTGFDAEFSVGGGFSLTSILSRTEDYIITQSTTPTASPPLNVVLYLDKDLQQNEGLGGRFQPIPTTYLTAAGEFFAFRSVNTFSETINRSDSNPLIITDSFVSEVITNPDSVDVYLKITDRGSQQKSIVKIADVPDINHSTAGIWHDPLIQNQGLVINRGKRADGSNYLFVSVYTQNQGQPLWLAGNADITLPQSSIDLELSVYRGSAFFESNTNITQESWGQVNLSMTACNALRATFTRPSMPNKTVDLFRIDNTQFDQLCSD